MTTASVFQHVPGRVPKCDLDAEAAVLSASTLSVEACDEALTILAPEDFYADANRRIYEAITELMRAGQAPDIVSIAAKLRDRGRLDQIGGTPYLAQIIDGTPAVVNIKAHCHLVLNAARIRRAGTVAHRFAAEAYGEIPDPQEWLQRFEMAAYKAAQDVHTESTASTYGEAAKAAFDLVTEASRAKTSTVGYPTGFSTLDNDVGGFAPGDLWLVGGRPGSGKTTWAMQAMENVCSLKQTNGAPVGVIFFSMEMKKRQLLLRSLSRRARVPFHNLRLGRLLPEQWRAFSEVGTASKKIPMIIDDGRGLTPHKLRSKVRRHLATLRNLFGSELVLGGVGIDYIQLMNANEGNDNRASELGEISKDCKQQAGEFETTYMALSSLKRPDNKVKVPKPQMTDLRDSGALDFDADVIMMLHRDDSYREKHEARDNLADLIVVKSRNSDTSTHMAQFDGRFYGFYPMDTVLFQEQPEREYG